MSPRRALRALLALAFIPASLAAQTGRVTTSDSARLYYRVIGQGADTIIAIHGGPGLDLESILGDFAVLGQRHTVIFYDQRGGHFAYAERPGLVWPEVEAFLSGKAR